MMTKEKQEAWDKANAVHVSVKINRNQDPELYEIFKQAEATGSSKGAIARDLMQRGLAAK